MSRGVQQAFPGTDTMIIIILLGKCLSAYPIAVCVLFFSAGAESIRLIKFILAVIFYNAFFLTYVTTAKYS